jgi:hypothetical protein
MATIQTLLTSGIQNPFTWNQGIKREIASYGATIERKITNIDWATECLKRIQFKAKQSTERGRIYLMTEDDMSFMEPIFLERQLPFSEYLTHCGYHPMTLEILEKTQTMKGMHPIDPDSPHGISAKRSALEGMMEKYGKHFSASYCFPCKGGASIKVSVISGKMFYSRTDAPYEIMGVALNEGDDGDEPIPYQTDEQLMIYLAKVLAHSQEY